MRKQKEKKRAFVVFAVAGGREREGRRGLGDIKLAPTPPKVSPSP